MEVRSFAALTLRRGVGATRLEVIQLIAWDRTFIIN